MTLSYTKILAVEAAVPYGWTDSIRCFCNFANVPKNTELILFLV